ncbi:hypothetical protein ACGFWF_01015 [Streptomyces sp. NPDC048581]|uniref:hypothetical protein n=1 Tax=Streptomyces sp. NPDC048581 TaxID=3365572 RepID=UPI00371E7FE6
MTAQTPPPVPAAPTTPAAPAPAASTPAPAPAHQHSFLEVGRCHYDAATQLAKSPPLYGPADHLAGIAAECAIKAMLLDFFGSVQDTPLGIPYSPAIRNRPTQSNRQAEKARKDSQHGHLPHVWDQLLLLANGHHGATVLAQIPQQNPFRESTDEWDVAHRYRDSGQISEQRVKRHLAAARTVIAAYQQAK